MKRLSYIHIFLSLFILFFATNKTYTIDQYISFKKPKVVTVSVQPLDELQIYNDTAFSVTIIVHDANNEQITYQVTLASEETFYKNARCRTAQGKRKLAQLILCDVDNQNSRMILYPMKTQFNDETWHSIRVNVSDIMNK